jgi:hypothetical protein
MELPTHQLDMGYIQNCHFVTPDQKQLLIVWIVIITCSTLGLNYKHV